MASLTVGQVVAGQVPYPRDSEPAKMWAHMGEPAPTPSRVAPEVVRVDVKTRQVSPPVTLPGDTSRLAVGP